MEPSLHYTVLYFNQGCTDFCKPLSFKPIFAISPQMLLGIIKKKKKISRGVVLIYAEYRA